ncbi:uncharacterized protein LOC21403402 [Morus notabilis]|uniref:uncharacterized protein LOC21403402 n=1 Tax=Morus notabilis TaxID=981085 RepID=UPI000CED7E7E|nr:uncharacterized protein LOC21403402 [Morus notabilis]
MGNLLNKQPPPPMVLVPPLFDFPPLAARTRMLESSYNMLFGKLALKCLFEDYFEEANHFTDSDSEEDTVKNALFRWQSDVYDPHTFVDLFVSSSNPILQMRYCSFNPELGIGAFGILPLLLRNRVSLLDNCVCGIRYGSDSLSIGAKIKPFSFKNECVESMWFVSRAGRLTVGLQYEPEYGRKDGTKYINLNNWSGAIGYCVGSGSPLSPSFNFCLELVKDYQFNASFYQHVVVQRRVKNPLEENEVVGITNYIDFGFELQTRVDVAEASNQIPESTFQVAASWQANKNFLLKGKLGPLSSAVALAFKSWWKPSFTFSISATRDHTSGSTAYGFGVRVENLREARYQRADPNFVMLTPNKEHLAEGIVWKIGQRPMLQSDINAGNFDGIPMELRPLERIL